MYQWLSYGGDSELFGRREFSFTTNAIYTRYNCYPSAELFAKDLLKRAPHKIDIGAFYNLAPSEHARVQGFEAVAKELVFDVDATDYADVLLGEGAEAQGSALTSRTWPWMAATVRVLERTLREDFGMEHILFVYSGRRGVHCWVCDDRARRLTNAGRTAVAEYFQLAQHEENKERRFNLRAVLPPWVKRALEEELLPIWEQSLVRDAALLSRPDHLQRILLLCPEEIRIAAQRKWGEGAPSGTPSPALSVSRWTELRGSVEEWQRQAGAANNQPLAQMVFTYLWPRLDVHVSTALNHLLKAPFVVHPSTGRVCVPFSPSEVRVFRPEDVPTLPRLVAELETPGTPLGGALAPALAVFDSFLSRLLRAEQMRRLKQEAPQDLEDLA